METYRNEIKWNMNEIEKLGAWTHGYLNLIGL